MKSAWLYVARTVRIIATLAAVTLATATPSSAQEEYYSTYNVPGAACVFDANGAGLFLCQGRPETPPPRFVAIAISNSTGANGSAWGFLSREDAEQRALSECGKYASDCEIAGWAYDQCLALAVAPDGSWGVDSALYVDIAEARALGRCNSVGKDCAVKLHPCALD